MATGDVDRDRFEGNVDRLAEAVGHADRRWPLEAYLTGLLLPGERKSVEPMAAQVDPRHVSRAHQSMHHFVASAPWDERVVLAVARDYALAQLERHAPVGAWVVDDTGIPKKGEHSVGVAWQYCGALGKPANCQVAVSVSLVNKTMSVPAAWRLYLFAGEMGQEHIPVGSRRSLMSISCLSGLAGERNKKAAESGAPTPAAIRVYGCMACTKSGSAKAL
jgi:SRSO17 transposase